MNTRRPAFTLFEVAISLAILAVGVTVMMALIPLGLRTQEVSRSRILAGINAVNMIESFNNMSFFERNLRLETSRGDDPWHSAAGRRSMNPDLEDKISTIYGGFAPVPLSIARRLDAPGDEIQAILDQGGQIYYATPGMPGGFSLNVIATNMLNPPNESGKLVFGIVGYAQQNAVPVFPAKTWPYYSEAFGPPDVTAMNHGDVLLDDQWFVQAMLFTTSAVYTASTNSEVGAVAPGLAGYMAYSYPTGKGTDTADAKPPATPEMAKRFFATAWWYAHRVMVRTGGESSPLYRALMAEIPVYRPGDPDLNPEFRALIDNLLTDGGNPDTAERQRRSAAYVAALRAVAFAANCVARHYTSAELAATDTKLIGPYPLPAHPGAYVPSFEIDVDAMADWPATIPPFQRDPEIIWSVPLSGAGAFQVPRFDWAAGNPLLTPPAYVTEERIRNWTETMMHALMRHSANYPYEWTLNRPANRAIMMDMPLIQHDLFPTGTYALATAPDGSYHLDGTIDPLTGGSRAYTTPSGPFPWFQGTIANSGVQARQWRWITPQPVRRIGRNAAGMAIPDSGAGSPWGDRAHFNVTAPFHPVQRCRQIVVWAVDWRAYQDFETAPSAPVDASKYPIDHMAASNPGNGLRPRYQNSPWVGFNANFRLSFVDAMNSFGGRGGDLERPSFRNPEKNLLYTTDTSGLATGRPMIDAIHDTDKIGQFSGYSFNDATFGVNVDRDFSGVDNNTKDLGSAGEGPAIFSGMYGADRNNNKVLDRGSLERSVRLRATRIAAFNYYDPRLHQAIR